jgi:DNA-binding response OmpR family regulator
VSEPVVLVVDDDRDLHVLLGVALRRFAGCRVESARSGAEGKTLALALRPSLILLDMTLPDVDGADLLRELKADAETRDLPIAVLSAEARRRDREELRAAGAAAVFAKPFRPSELAAEVSRIIARGR